MNGKFFQGITAGFTGALVIAVLIYILNWFDIHVKLITAISQIFVSKDLVGTFQGNIIGLIGHLACGSLVGAGILIAFEVTGHEHSTMKGAALGAGAWFFLCGIMAKLLELNMQSNFLGSLFNLLVHIVYGMVAAWVIMYFHGKSAIES